MAFPSVNEQMELLRRGAEQIIPEDELVAKLERSLKDNRPLKIKLGCDPSRPDLHLGHAVVLRKLRHFQDLGHQAILVVGDFTAMIGDPSGRNKTRPALSIEETRKNGKSYYEQATKVLSKKRLRITYNSDWLGKLDFADLIKFSSYITVARLLERDDFAKRLQEQTPISFHELLYPLAQAYDSVELEADVELGGTDQTFNLLMARDLQRAFGQEPQAILTTPLLEGTGGGAKMSKSYDNYVGLTDPPDQMYGRVMSIPDGLIVPYFEYCTNISAEELTAVRDGLSGSKVNPRDTKRQLAREIVTLYHSSDAAQEAEQAFDRIFIQKEVPDKIPEFHLKLPEAFLVQVLKESGLVASNSEGRRLISQGAVTIDREVVSDPNHMVYQGNAHMVKVGKRRFLLIGAGK
ncbi:MAG: tyrosine--tRNA ligase [Candidatus Marinimicrobia bacterium]|nr:tyrosine--tRNA ligase [Candidatus Neomarinimicrobiota bacterium]